MIQLMERGCQYDYVLQLCVCVCVTVCAFNVLFECAAVCAKKSE